jgi:hypothetical protein
VDLLIAFGSKVLPLEIKAGGSGTLEKPPW